MMWSPGKKQNRRRREAAPKRGTAVLKNTLRHLPRPRMPRGRNAWICGILLAACALAAWPLGRACLRGDLLTVSRLEVTGNRHWPSDRLLERAGLEVGQRMHEIPFRAARKRLLALPGVESVSVRYTPGGRLHVSIREADVVAMRRTPVGAFGASVWRGLTSDGQWMPLAARTLEEVPVLEGRGMTRGAEHRAAAWLAGVRTRHPDLFAGFSQFSPRGTGGEADVYWRDGRVRLRVDCAGGEGSLANLGELLRREQGNWAEGATVDLRVEGYAYVQ